MLSALAILSFAGGFASAGEGRLATGEAYKTERLGDSLWRVRVKRADTWPESGMNRYGILAEPKVLETSSSLDFGKVKPAMKLVGKGFEVRFPLAEGERVFGLGDVSRENIQRRPGSYEIFVKNVNSYIPMPMAWTSRGWGVLMNTTWRNRFDVGKTDPGAMVVTAPEGEIDFYVFTGRGPAEILDVYTQLTGRPQLLPIWGFGFTFVANQWIDQFELVSETVGFREREIPCDVIGLEPGWMETFYDFSTRKRWHGDRFSLPSWRPAGAHTFPEAMKRVGMKLSLWLCCDYDLFRYEEELVRDRRRAMKGGGVAAADGEVWFDENIEGKKAEKKKYRRDPPPALRRGVYAGDPEPHQHREGEEPWFEHLKQFVDQGASAFKLDGACQVTDGNGWPGRRWANGMDSEEAHNLYPLVYDKQMARGFEDYTGRRAMVYSAGGYAGVQQYVATWAGDTGGGTKPLVSVLTLAMSGHPNQSCDMTVRDKHGKPTFNGMHFGFLSPWAQQNNWDYWDLPWLNEKPVVDAFRRYVELRYRLAPYIYSAAARASRTGYPIARPLSLVYPDRPEYDECRTTYMLGDSLLVGVFSESAEIPEGTWFDWRTGESVTGPCRRPIRTEFGWGGALYVKAGAIVPTWPVMQHLDKGWNEEVVLHVWPGADGSFDLYEDDGTSLAYRKGAFATTRIELKGGALSIGRREGAYDGMPETRRFKAVVHEGGNTREVDFGAVGAAGASRRLADK